MNTTFTTPSFAHSFVNRNTMPMTSARSTPSQKYFSNLESKFSAKKSIDTKNSFEFSFDDMF